MSVNLNKCQFDRLNAHIYHLINAKHRPVYGVDVSIVYGVYTLATLIHINLKVRYRFDNNDDDVLFLINSLEAFMQFYRFTFIRKNVLC